MKNLQALLNEWPADLPGLDISEPYAGYIVVNVTGFDGKYFGGFDIYPNGETTWSTSISLEIEAAGRFSVTDIDEMRRVIGIFGEAIKRRAAYPEYKGLPEKEEKE